jgi:hypothetical protein
MRKAIGVATIVDNCILLVKKRESWILPGGKPEDKETDQECLAREVGEELSGCSPTNPIFWREFKGITPHQNDLLKCSVYFSGIIGTIIAGAEITEATFVKTEDLEDMNLSDITRKIIDQLIREGYLRV